MCGEKFYVDEVLPGDTGSPPHVRGKVDGVLDVRLEHGITPACAGKRQHQGLCPPTGRDHPRVCGEKYCCTLMACRSWGSPPRMRGKVSQRKGAWDGDRITPAYAGKSIHGA